MKDIKYNIRFARGVILYIWITYLIYLILPSEASSNIKEIYTIVFLLWVSAAFYFGCASLPVRKSEQVSTEFNGLLFKDGLLQILLILCTFFTVMYMVDMLSQGLGSFSLDIGENYVTYQESESRYNSVWGQFYVLFSPVRFFLIAYCILVLKRISKASRLWYYLFLVSTFLHSLIQGKNVGLGYIVLMIGVAYFIICLKNHTFKKYKRIATIGGAVFIVYFVFSITLRTEAYGGAIEDQLIDPNGWMVSVFGIRGTVGITRLLSYFSHGYKGLNYCLQLPFEWTYGYGGAMGIDSYISQYFGVPSQLPNTYPVRMEAVFGYSGLQSWPTVFPWWASDLSFPGVVVFMFFIGRFMCTLLKESYCKSNLLSAVLFSYFFIMIACLPLNNQILQTRPTFLTTAALLFLWVFSSSRLKKRNYA